MGERCTAAGQHVRVRRCCAPTHAPTRARKHHARTRASTTHAPLSPQERVLHAGGRPQEDCEVEHEVVHAAGLHQIGPAHAACGLYVRTSIPSSVGCTYKHSRLAGRLEGAPRAPQPAAARRRKSVSEHSRGMARRHDWRHPAATCPLSLAHLTRPTSSSSSPTSSMKYSCRWGGGRAVEWVSTCGALAAKGGRVGGWRAAAPPTTASLPPAVSPAADPTHSTHRQHADLLLRGLRQRQRGRPPCGGGGRGQAQLVRGREAAGRGVAGTGMQEWRGDGRLGGWLQRRINRGRGHWASECCQTLLSPPCPPPIECKRLLQQRLVLQEAEWCAHTGGRHERCWARETQERAANKHVAAPGPHCPGHRN